MQESANGSPAGGATPHIQAAECTEGRVLLVEDDQTVRTAAATCLRQAGFEVRELADGAEAVLVLNIEEFDVFVFDRMLPGVSGDELCELVRRREATPILMLTALADVEDRVDGLTMGADDYLTKPFSLHEMMLRVQSLVRRSRLSPAPLEKFMIGNFTVDPSRRRVWLSRDEIQLTTREYELLYYFLRHPGVTLSRDQLLQRVWGWKLGEGSNVTVHVRRLREKVERDPGEPIHLRTVWGVGYQFSPDGVTV